MSDKPRPKTEEEVRDELLALVKSYVEYWANTPSKTTKERLDGLAFSILCIFDGVTTDLPAMDIVLRPHEEDEDYNKQNGENWYVDGQVINDCMLYELYYGKGGE